MVTGWALIVMPRSFSRSIESSNCSSMSRVVIVPVRCSNLSESVVFPWSIWAMMLKFLMCAASIFYNAVTSERVTGDASASVYHSTLAACLWRPRRYADFHGIKEDLCRTPNPNEEGSIARKLPSSRDWLERPASNQKRQKRQAHQKLCQYREVCGPSRQRRGVRLSFLPLFDHRRTEEIGRASCRERV